jgi:hypothetical protein
VFLFPFSTNSDISFVKAELIPKTLNTETIIIKFTVVVMYPYSVVDRFFARITQNRKEKNDIPIQSKNK